MTLPWTISKTLGSEIEYVFGYFESMLMKKIKIVPWGERIPILLKNGRKMHGGRWKIDFADNKFVFKTSNAKYNDSRNFSIKVVLEPYEKAVGVAIAVVQGMFFSYYQ